MTDPMTVPDPTPEEVTALARAWWINGDGRTSYPWAASAWDRLGSVRDSDIRADHELIAERVLRSDAFARRDARIKAEALREAAVRFDAIALGAWGGPASWMTSGSKVGALVSGILRQWAADEAGEKPDVCTDGHARWRPGRDRL